MEVIMKYTSFYPVVALSVLCMGASTNAEVANTIGQAVATTAKMGWIEWMGSKLDFGSLSLGGGTVTVDSTKGSSLLVAALGSSLGWIKQNPKVAAAITIYGLYRLKMNRIQDEKIKELIVNLTAATGAAISANSVDAQKQAIHSAIKQLASEANLSCISWFSSLRWMPKWTPLVSKGQNLLSTAASNLAIIEPIANKEEAKITLDDAKTLHKMFTATGL